MTKELQEKLFNKYPKIFRQKDLSMMETCMCWGIDTDEGWFFLLDQLCNSIQSYIDLNEHLKIPQVEAVQVKEKFGALCFYTNGGDNRIDGMIQLAENMSYHICEKCGTTENVGHTTGWIVTLCESCSNKEERYKNSWVRGDKTSLRKFDINKN